ncbi:MAG: hypothetical protein ACE5KU_00340 [Nitrososphaerales archaeon]
MAKDAGSRRRIKITLLGLLVIMAVLIIGGAFLGFYLSELLGNPDSILLPILFATLGFGISIVVSLYVAKVVGRATQ